MTTDRGRSIIFYPRSYNTRGENKKHSMMGVTESGKTINVKLRLDDKHEGKENAPSIKEFAKTDFLAKNPCIASEDNSADNPEGILLLSRCIKDNFDNDKGVEVYIARWAVVLSPSSQTPAPHKGIGRMEIKKDSSTVKKLRGLMRKSESENRLDDADAFKKQIEDPVSWSFPAIFYYPEKMVSFSLGNSKPVEEKASLELTNLAKSGIVSGMAVRARNSSNEVVKDTYKEIFSKFIISKTRYQNGTETFKSIISELEEKYGNENYKWDAIPIKKINTGPASSRHYGAKDRLSFTRSMFTFDSNDNEPRLAKICVRVSYFGDTDNTLLSRLYTISEPLDHPARLDKSGHFSLTFTGEGTKLAHLPSEDESINQIRDGFSEDENLIKRALWLLEGNVPIIRSIEESRNGSQVREDIQCAEATDVEEKPTDSVEVSEAPGVSSSHDDLDAEEKLEDDLSDEDDGFEFNEIEGDSEEIEEKMYENSIARPKEVIDSDETSFGPQELQESSVDENDDPEAEGPSPDNIDVRDSEEEIGSENIDLEAEEEDEEPVEPVEPVEPEGDSEADDQDSIEPEASDLSQDSDAESEAKESSANISSRRESPEKEPDTPKEKKLTGMAASLFGKK